MHDGAPTRWRDRTSYLNRRRLQDKSVKGEGGRVAFSQRHIPSLKASLSLRILSVRCSGSTSGEPWVATPSIRSEGWAGECSRAWRSTYITLSGNRAMVTEAETATSLATGAPLPRTELVWTRRFRQKSRQRSPFWLQRRDEAARDIQARVSRRIGTGAEFAVACL